jgi:hypothetical protein
LLLASLIFAYKYKAILAYFISEAITSIASLKKKSGANEVKQLRLLVFTFRGYKPKGKNCNKVKQLLFF